MGGHLAQDLNPKPAGRRVSGFFQFAPAPCEGSYRFEQIRGQEEGLLYATEDGQEEASWAVYSTGGL